MPWGAREGAGPGSRGPQQHCVGSPCLPQADRPDNEDRHVSVSWKHFGVSVSVSPVVMLHGRISLNISAEGSELTSDGAVSLNDIAIPALKVRRAKATLELPSGGTLAMAGRISDDTRQSVVGVPGLPSIPILGALFRSNDYQRKESELVILQGLFLGHSNRSYRVPGHVPRGRDEGDYRLIVEYPDAGVKR